MKGESHETVPGIRTAEEEVVESVRKLESALDQFEIAIGRRSDEITGRFREIGLELQGEVEEIRDKADGILGEVSETLSQPRRALDDFIAERLARAESVIQSKKADYQQLAQTSIEELRVNVVSQMEQGVQRLDEIGDRVFTRVRGNVQGLAADIANSVDRVLTNTLRVADRRPLSIWMAFLSVGFFAGLYVGISAARTSLDTRVPVRQRGARAA